MRQRVRGDVHVQNVNGCHSRLRGWLRHPGTYRGWLGDRPSASQ